jgi:hypothetical protein
MGTIITQRPEYNQLQVTVTHLGSWLGKLRVPSGVPSYENLYNTVPFIGPTVFVEYEEKKIDKKGTIEATPIRTSYIDPRLAIEFGRPATPGKPETYVNKFDTWYQDKLKKGKDVGTNYATTGKQFTQKMIIKPVLPDYDNYYGVSYGTNIR